MLIRAIVWKALLVLLALSHFNKITWVCSFFFFFGVCSTFLPLQGRHFTQRVLCHIIASIFHMSKTATWDTFSQDVILLKSCGNYANFCHLQNDIVTSGLNKQSPNRRRRLDFLPLLLVEHGICFPRKKKMTQAMISWCSPVMLVRRPLLDTHSRCTLPRENI